MNLFDGIDRSASPVRLADAKIEPLTPERILDAYRLMLEHQSRPQPEFHHPKCPKWTTQGRLGCRCGAAPLWGVFEDELARMRGEEPR